MMKNLSWLKVQTLVLKLVNDNLKTPKAAPLTKSKATRFYSTRSTWTQRHDISITWTQIITWSPIKYIGMRLSKLAKDKCMTCSLKGINNLHYVWCMPCGLNAFIQLELSYILSLSKANLSHIVCLYPLALSFFSILIFIQPNFPHKGYFSFSHPTFFILLLITCFLYYEPMTHAQLGPIDGSLLFLQENHILNQV